MIPSPRETRTLFVDGRRVQCQAVTPAETGDRPAIPGLPLLLLHGLGCSSEAWRPTLECLQRQALDQPGWAPDLPGYGQTPGPRPPLGIDELADWSARFLDALAIERAHVAGSSMGCQVAMALAHRHPQRVGRLVLVGPTTGESGGSLARYLIRLLRDGCRESLQYNLTLVRMYWQMGLRRYLATVRQMMRDDALARAPGVTAPCLVVRGHADAIVTAAIARKLTAALPHATLAEVEGAAHAAQFTQPDQFVSLTLAFLAGGRTTRASLLDQC